MSVARNTGYNLASALVPIAVSLVILPLYIHTIGAERYGMVALIGALVGYFGVFDLGLSAAVTQRLAATPAGEFLARRQIFWTAAATNVGFGVAGGLLILPVAHYYAGHGLNAPADLMPEIGRAMWWLALALPVALLNGVLRGGLLGAERFLELNAINIVVGTISQFAPLLAAWLIAPTLDVVLPALYLTRVLNIGCFAWVLARRVLGSWRPAFDRARVKDLLTFGGWVTVSSLLSPLMTTADRYFIGSLAGLKAVSYYAVPFQIAERTMILPSALGSALMPRIAATQGEGSHEMGIRALRAIAAVMGPFMIAGVVVLHPLLNVWIGREFAGEAAFAGQILLMGFWWNALGIACFAWLYGMGKARLVAIAHVVEIVPYFIILVALLKLYGLPGAAAAFSLRVAADAILLAKFAGLAREVLRLSLFAVVGFAFAQWASLPLDVFDPASLALAALPILLAGGVSLAWIYSERQSLLWAIRDRRSHAAG